MRIGVCFFIESNLGGAATQADDLVTVSRRAGHDACLLRFTTSPRSRNLFDIRNGHMPDHKLLIGRTGIRFVSDRILLSEKTLPKTIKYLNTFDLLIYVGGCPHITRSFTETDFYRCYHSVYADVHCTKTLFLTDPFWSKLYPYAKDIVQYVDKVYAFAEAYRRAVVESDLCQNVGICNFGSVMACDKAVSLKKRVSEDKIIWPHQWRSWKNPDLFIRMVPYLAKSVKAYSDGIEYHKIRRDNWKAFKTAVQYDHMKDEQLNPEGNAVMFGTVPQVEIIEEFFRCRWMIDLTGMSARTGKPLEKFIGNYQCVNLECMMLGCVNFKYENTIEPFSQLPRDCVVSMPLVTDPRELAKHINNNLGVEQYQRVARRAREWSLDQFSPDKVFDKCFVQPFV